MPGVEVARVPGAGAGCRRREETIFTSSRFASASPESAAGDGDVRSVLCTPAQLGDSFGGNAAKADRHMVNYTLTYLQCRPTGVKGQKTLDLAMLR